VELDPKDGVWNDPGGYLRSVQGKAAQMAAGYEVGIKHAVPGLDAAGLLFAGMGFSGVGSDLVRDACTRVMDQPFTIVKHYQFPHHVRRDWHLLAVSYSGTTEETLSVAREAKRRGVPTTAFCTGGPLAELAERNVPQAPGFQPRMAFGHAWFSMLGFLEGSGILKERVPLDAALKAVRDADKAYGPSVPEANNPAKQLARVLHDKLPQLYATPAFYGVAYAFRAWLNENAKKIVSVDHIPECNHNDLTGWGGDVEGRRNFAVVLISHSEQNPQIMSRLAFMRSRYEEWGVPLQHVETRPVHSFRDHVAAQASALQLLDYAGFYTAMLRGVDPCEIRLIEGLKAHLRR
jgi:glucose/mannose-6-phosphate isomerase